MEPSNVSPDGTCTGAGADVQRWFYALDQRRIDIGSRSWVVEVTGIHADDAELWIQLAPVGRPDRGIVLRVSPHTTINEAKAALEKAWSGPVTRRPVIDLTQAA
jgi:hypothetical protein